MDERGHLDWSHGKGMDQRRRPVELLDFKEGSGSEFVGRRCHLIASGQFYRVGLLHASQLAPEEQPHDLARFMD
jgi:hypothetical protein